MAELKIDRISYIPGDVITFELDISKDEIPIKNLRNINVNIFKVNVARNNFALGFGFKPKGSDKKIKIEKTLPDTMSEGLYTVQNIKLIFDESGDKTYLLLQNKNLPLLFFVVVDNKKKHYDEMTLNELISTLTEKRKEYRNRILQTSTTSASRKIYKVLVIGVGCLVHSSQELSGYTIYPLGTGLSYKHMNEAVNSFLKPSYRFELPYDHEIEKAFKNATPLFAIDYKRVEAADHNNAISHCINISENLFTILAYDKGQRPRPVATIILDIETGQMWHSFHFPGYSGNLVSDFDPKSTADKIDRVLPLIDQVPWVKLLLESYGNAIAESNFDFAYLKYWAILEMVAKKYVTDNNIAIIRPNNSLIKDELGRDVTTSRIVAKVYHFLFTNDIPTSHSSSSVPDHSFEIVFETNKAVDDGGGKTIIRLWECVSACYEIRNQTAHTGDFDIEKSRNGSRRQKLAATFYSLGFNNFLDNLKRMTNVIISKEIDKAVEQLKKQFNS